MVPRKKQPRWSLVHGAEAHGVDTWGPGDETWTCP